MMPKDHKVDQNKPDSPAETPAREERLPESTLGTQALFGALAPYMLLRDWSYHDFY